MTTSTTHTQSIPGNSSLSEIIKSLSIKDAPFTKIVIVNTDAKTFKFRCYGAKEFLEKIKNNISDRS
jgi:hypothetical protein